MFKKIYQPFVAVAIAFILSIGPTWAATYSDTLVIKSKDKFNERKPRLELVPRHIGIRVSPKAVESYLEAHNLNEIELKVEMTEELVQYEDENGDVDETYHLDFTFTPAGCYFDRPLQLKVKGKYKKTGYSASLSNIEGNGIAHDRTGRGIKIHDFGEAGENYYNDWLWAASYFGSVVVEKGKGGNIYLNQEASIKIKNKSVDDYLDEMILDSVEIICDMFYGWDGSIWFVFGPSGTFFTPDELELTIKGGYLVNDMLLIGEDGEFLEYTFNDHQTKLTFYIPHFSCYYYEDYNY